jgi:hypothetical protein
MRPIHGAGAALIAAASVATADIVPVTIMIENLAPANGTWLTPAWFGFHDGTFNPFNAYLPASVAIERLAEDGNLDPLRANFAAANAGFRDGVAMGPVNPPIAPGQTAMVTILVDDQSPLNRYFSYASMIIPSNDAFIMHDNPAAFQVFTPAGMLIQQSFVVRGVDIWDAGTEVNDEIPMNTAFFGQMTPNTGQTEGGVIRPHPGFLGSMGNPQPLPRILADPMFANADFTVPGYEVARITIIPAPSGAVALAMLGALTMLRRRRR